MAKVSLTKNELKRQREALRRFYRYLPMLLLKKKQLQLEIAKIHQIIRSLVREIESLRKNIIAWVDLFAERMPWDELCSLISIKTGQGNVAGIDLPTFLGIEFREKSYDLLLTPFWVDKAIEAIKEMLTLKAKLSVYHKQMDILKEELRITTQRVNLFEKIKIPQGLGNIRIIQIYLGELRTSEVVRGKIAKAKLEQKKLVMV